MAIMIGKKSIISFQWHKNVVRTKLQTLFIFTEETRIFSENDITDILKYIQFLCFKTYFFLKNNWVKSNHFH